MKGKDADDIVDMSAEAPAAHPLSRHPTLASPATGRNPVRHMRLTEVLPPWQSAETLSGRQKRTFVRAVNS